MKPVKALIILAVIAFLAITVFSLLPASNTEEKETADVKSQLINDSTKLSYQEKIDSLRAYQQSFMASNEKSPFIIQKEKFDSLKYFPVDTSFRVKAMVIPIPIGKTYELETSDGSTRKYKEVAELNFSLLKTDQSLSLLESIDGEHYFLPFYDKSSALSTYGAGRYLEVDYSGKESSITLDFNMAYNPYCAYVNGYSCPVPPASNQITIAVEAGEKTYK